MLSPRGRTRTFAVALVALIALLGGVLVTPGVAGAVSGPTTAGSPVASAGVVPPHHLASIPLHPANGSGTPVTSPSWLAYDTADHAFYVAAPPSSVDIVYGNDSPLGVNVTVGVGLDPFGVAFDNATGDVFVTNSGSNSVSVLSGVEPNPITNISVGSDPLGIAFLSSNGDLYVANQGSNNVTVIDGATLAVVGSVTVGRAPLGVAADPSRGGQVFVANEGSSSVSVIAAGSGTVTATVPVGDEPYGVALDNRSDEIFVTNYGSSNVSAIDAATDAAVASIPVVWPGGELQGIAYDPGDGLVWAGAGFTYMVVIDPTQERVVDYVGTDPSGVAYDPDNGNVCVTNTANATFECIQLPRDATSTVPLTFLESGLPSGTEWSVALSWGVGGPTLTTTGNNTTVWIMPWQGESLEYAVAAVGVDYAPIVAHGTVELAAQNVSVDFFPGATEEPVTFAETNLPAGDTWWVSLAGVTEGSAGPTLQFLNPTPNSTYEVLPAPGLNPSPSTGFVAEGASPVTVNITFQPANASYEVEFYEGDTSYPSAWGVAVDGEIAVTNTRFVLLYLENGTYNYTAFEGTSVGGTEVTGTVVVAGMFNLVSVSFVPTTPTYPVQFTETGLPSGIPWVVNLSGEIGWSNFSTVGFSVPNGTYWFLVYPVSDAAGTWSPDPTNGTVVVAGDSLVIAISFTQTGFVEYPVTFSESGLGYGSTWSVNLSGAIESTTVESGGVGARIGFDEPNGSYAFAVSPPSGATPSPPSGQVSVSGNGVTVSIQFSSTNSSTPRPATFAVGFYESGLPNGTSWSVTLASTLGSSSGSRVGFTEQNGSYDYSVGTVTGYQCANGTGSLSVAGSPVVVLVYFSATTYAVDVTESGLPTGTLWTVTAVSTMTTFSTSARSTSSEATLELPEGTYQLSAVAPKGMSVVLVPDVVTVTGSGTVAASATFSTTSGGTATGSGVVWVWELSTGIAIAAVLALLAILLATRRRPPVPTWWSPSAPSGGPPTEPPT